MTDSITTIVGHVTCRKPKNEADAGIQTLKFTIRDFESLDTERGRPYFATPTLNAHGHRWKLKLTLVSPDDKIGIYLRHIGRGSINARYHFHEVPSLSSDGMKCLKQDSLHGGDICSRRCFIERYLDEKGDFTVHVDIEKGDPFEAEWWPREGGRRDFLYDLWETRGEDGDVHFKVENKVVSAHSIVLYHRCEVLHHIYSESQEDHVPIPDISYEAFEAVLRYVYVFDTWEWHDLECAQSVIKAADRFELIHMKLLAESEVVCYILDKENAAELLVFADAHSCALLKEAAFDVYKKDPMTVRKSNTWSKVKESPKLLDELLEYVSCDKPKLDEDGKEIIENLKVGVLRDRIALLTPDDSSFLYPEEDEWVEAVSGTKETLVRRLKELMQKNDKEESAS